MNSPRYLTKSRFKLAVECPTKLFYAGKDQIYRNLKQEDSFLQALANGGFQVGKMATMLYPEGVEITAQSNTAAEQQTRDLIIQHENITLFEPAIRFENLFIRIDILVKRGQHFELIEVKAKSYKSGETKIGGVRTEILSDMLPYIQDVAFQKYVLQLAYPKATIVSYLMMPDKAVRVAVDGLNQFFKVRRKERKAEVTVSPNARVLIERFRSVLALVPVDNYVDIVMTKGIKVGGAENLMPLPNLVNTFSDLYYRDERAPPNLHKGCSNCEFREYPGGTKRSGYHECVSLVTKMSVSEIDQGTVLDIWHFRKKDQLLRQGVYRYSQVTEDDITVIPGKGGLSRSERQWMQVRGIPKEQETKGYFVDRELIRQYMSQWKYPLHMIDFETATVPLPFFAGMRPYETIAFQYSHHVIEEDGLIHHAGQFLMAEPGKFPNFEFLRALRRDLQNDGGTIFRWAVHEDSVLNQIAGQLSESDAPPDDQQELLDFITRVTKGGDRAMVDLAVIAERAYFHPDTKARVSIKKVLPAVLKSSDYLRQKYRQPIYGREITSKNYSGFSWWEERSGKLIDPYQRLKELSEQMLGTLGADVEDADFLEVDINIAEGGAAAMAFARLQFEDLAPETRQAVKAALLRYCELDTLAMVMIVEAWREWCIASRC